jgi:hypothetical protein
MYRFLLTIFTFLVAVCLLWASSEGINPIDIQKSSIPIATNRFSNDAQGKLVSVTGDLTAPLLRDSPYLKPGLYITLKRKVRMLSWVEEQSQISENKPPEYTYTEQWLEYPPNSGKFKERENHKNPTLKIHSNSQSVQTANIGVYKIDPLQISLPKPTEIQLTDSDVVIPKPKTKTDLILSPTFLSLVGSIPRREGNYIYIGSGSLVGDVRIHYEGVPQLKNVTVFGKLDKDQIVPYLYKNSRIYNVYFGNRDAAIADINSQYKANFGFFLLMPIIGFLLMWILVYLYSPQPTSCRLTFGVAISISIVAIAVACITYNYFWVLFSSLLLLVVAWQWFQRIANSFV